MTERLVTRWLSRLRERFDAFPPFTVHYVPDDAGWSFKWDAHYITTGLRERCGLRARVARNPWRLRRQIIHFGDRYAFLDSPRDALDPSNILFLTWFHGGPASPDARLQRLFGVLKNEVHRLRKVVVSCRISERALTQGGIPADKLELIPLGVDLERFVPPTPEQRRAARHQLSIPEDAVCIGSFQKDGTGWGEGLEPKWIKGPDVLVDVISRLAQSTRIVTLLTGPARGYVKQGLTNAGVPYVHRILKRYHDIVTCYHAADLCVIPSRCEGGPKALLESWATGVPVVSTRVGMSADLIEHSVNGMLAEVDDAQALADHARRLIEDASLRDACRFAALEQVKPYAWPLIAEQYYRGLYRTVLEAPEA